LGQCKSRGKRRGSGEICERGGISLVDPFFAVGHGQLSGDLILDKPPEYAVAPTESLSKADHMLRYLIHREFLLIVRVEYAKLETATFAHVAMIATITARIAANASTMRSYRS
jgi:hypothetical protein